ncbi:MAG: hypothetical protein ABR598_07720 [Candidatus Dormibacteria bacterium]
MSLSLGSAIKAHLEHLSPGLGIDIWVRKPDEEVLPFLLIFDDINTSPDPAAAPGAVGGRKGVISEPQLSLWQAARGTAGPGGKRARAFDPVLPELVAAALDGVRLRAAVTGFPARIYGCHLAYGPREIPSPVANNRVQHVIGLRIHRNLITVRP